MGVGGKWVGEKGLLFPTHYVEMSETPSEGASYAVYESRAPSLSWS